MYYDFEVKVFFFWMFLVALGMGVFIKSTNKKKEIILVCFLVVCMVGFILHLSHYAANEVSLADYDLIMKKVEQGVLEASVVNSFMDDGLISIGEFKKIKKLINRNEKMVIDKINQQELMKKKEKLTGVLLGNR